jgi:hypothetical protein
MGNLNFCNSFFYVSVIYETTRQPIVIFFVCIGEASGRNFSSAFRVSFLLSSWFTSLQDQKREYLKSNQTNLVVLYYICSNFFDDVIKDPLFDKGQFIPWSSESVILGNDDFFHLILKFKCNVFKNTVTKI